MTHFDTFIFFVYAYKSSLARESRMRARLIYSGVCFQSPLSCLDQDNTHFSSYHFFNVFLSRLLDFETGTNLVLGVDSFPNRASCSLSVLHSTTAFS
jgi:hypothetical protein